MTKLQSLPRIAAALSLAFALAACGQGQQGAGAPPPPTVTVAKPTVRAVTDQDEYVGRFVAIDAVEVRARVSGYLDKIHFRDGQMVKQGDLLFTIDKRPFENTVAQQRANLAQAKANLAFAESDLERGKQLVRERTISEQVFQQRTQAFGSAQAAVAANEAAVKQAELDLEFTELRAPVDGRIGDRRVSPGNLVTGGTTGTTTMLGTIVSMDPIRFEFTMDEASYLRYERFSKMGKEVTGRAGGMIVGLKLLDEKNFDRRGAMDFVDNVIDKSSGTIRGRAVFSNPDGVLTPGMFGRIRVPGSPSYDALLLPDAAIGTEQIKKYVLVVDGENKAVMKYVTLGQLTDDNLRVIKDGIDANDRVVVNGLMRARPGQKVNPQEKGASPSAAAATGAESGTQAKN
ncbi:efflux RND transporter periplasmic adaptor subunit [Rhodoplanes sp. Z2-YC6860]|uniref:efflux RND transporter periplasmic adaptor subunit n=1 Tax=Rhodoplanes sp. Z2-YC6860 TaxID=674703 RepID=UPI00078BDA29|nr:efflux RND transporter periplasmic adaptor subunit [Rhodoplanes sp. Z2-YC6860]AMN43398.1 RND family efflux transporter MFP subunit [Rhodoplanes sp. Z2-YC6860]